MTDTTNRLRAVFLTALMVFSVFAGTIAFAGTAAAGSPSFVSAVEYDDNAADNDQGDIELVFADTAEKANNPGSPLDLGTNITVYYNDNNVTSAFDIDRTTNNNARYVLNSSRDFTPNGTLTISVDNATSGSGFASFDNETVQITSATVEVNRSSPPSATNFQGAPIAHNFSSVDTTFEITADGDPFQGPFGTGANSTTFVQQTGSLETGVDYNVTVDTNGDGFGDTVGARLSFRSYSLSASLTSSTSQTTTGEESVDVDITSSAGNRLVEVVLENDSVVDTEFVRLAGDGTASVSLNGSGNNLAAGDYNVTVTDVELGVEATTATTTVTAVTGAASFSSQLYTDQRGDELNITVNLDNANSAFVYIGGSDSNYGPEVVEVTDGNDDGEVKIQWNTYDDTFETFGDDELNQTSGALGDTPASGSYSLEVRLAPDGDTEGVATVQLNEGSLTEARSWVAPSGASTDTPGEILDAVTQSSSVAADDQLVLQVLASGLYGQLSEDSNLNRTLSGGSGIYLELVQQNPGRNQQANVINASNVTRIVTAPSQDTFFVVLNNPEDFAGVDRGETYQATFVVNETTPLVDDTSDEVDTASVSTTFTVTDRVASFNGLNSTGNLNLATDAGVTVSGTSTVAPGTNVTVQIRSTTSGVPFFQTQPGITVGSDGTWSTTFDLSSLPAGTDIQVTVSTSPSFDETEQVTGVIKGQPTATVTFNDQTSNGEVVTVESVTMNQGGFVAIHQGSASGPVIGFSKYLEPGTHQNVRIALDESVSDGTTLVAMPHQDTNDNQNYEFPERDGPYTANGTPVTDSAAITVQTGVQTVVQTETRTVVQTVTRTVERTVVQTQTRTVVRTVTRTVQTGGQPGFGIAVAITALLAAALLAIRRRDE